MMGQIFLRQIILRQKIILRQNNFFTSKNFYTPIIFLRQKTHFLRQ